jgi:WhiB family redox-sensing transcriptional regulator
MVRAECRHHDPELWFPVSKSDKCVGRARNICRGLCPVMDECLTYALRYDQWNGMWGGLTDVERRHLPQEEVDRALAGKPRQRLPEAEDWEYCGTVAGEIRHRRRGEKVCRACRDAASRLKVDLAMKRRNA